MSDSLSLGWSQSDARRKRDAYRRLLAVNLALQSLLALIVLIYPSGLLSLLALDGPGALPWARVWAAMVLLASAFQVPALLEPVNQRLPSVIGITGRFGMTILYLCLGGGFLWLALFDGIFAVLLFMLFQRAILGELQTRP
ncbi:hypothetical protein FMN50_12110 [Rhodobacterales bacterium]|nr:hypothetical protein FMN50_12110 [Rhodobacterales bacterium]